MAIFPSYVSHYQRVSLDLPAIVTFPARLLLVIACVSRQFFTVHSLFQPLLRVVGSHDRPESDHVEHTSSHCWKQQLEARQRLNILYVC